MPRRSGRLGAAIAALARRRNLQISFQERLDTVDMTLDHGELEPKAPLPPVPEEQRLQLWRPHFKSSRHGLAAFCALLPEGSC